MKTTKTTVSTASSNNNKNQLIKKAASDIIDFNNKKPTKREVAPILTTNQQSGYGLWCIANEKKEEVKTKQIPDEATHKNDGFFNDVDKKLIEKLKRQVTDLTIRLDSALSKSSESEYLAQRSENNRQIYFELAEKRLKEISEYDEKQKILDENIMNLNEALTSAKKEINRLQSCLQVEDEKANNYYELYQNLMLEKERREANLSSEVHALSAQLNLITHERENMVKVLQSGPNVNEMASNFQKKFSDFEDKNKTNEIFIGKLQAEIVDLKKKLKVEEGERSKLNEVNKRKNEKIDYFEAEMEKFRGFFEDCKKEVKWNQNTVLQKENDLKVYSDKIKKLTEENTKLTKKIETLSKKKKSENNNNENNQEAEEICIKSKPYLFGPETNDC